MFCALGGVIAQFEFFPKSSAGRLQRQQVVLAYWQFDTVSEHYYQSNRSLPRWNAMGCTS
jgi:hypothetical protein